jgi:hypothetical protein
MQVALLEILSAALKKIEKREFQKKQLGKSKFT